MVERRVAERRRTTKETDIRLRLDLDGRGVVRAATGVPFLDHLLELFGRHGLFDLDVEARGDVAVDYHHTVEDVGLVLGDALREAVGDKRGIARYGFFLLPMDECLARVAVDLGGRPYFVYDVACAQPMVRDFNVILVREFFRAFGTQAAANLHLALVYGDEPHHIGESLFKATARAVRMAVAVDPRAAGEVPSTKGVL